MTEESAILVRRMYEEVWNEGKLEEYRRAGITQPIIPPKLSGANPKEEAMQIIRACAPR